MKVLKSVERSGKKFLIRLIKIFIKQENFGASDLDTSKVDRIIIIHLDRKVGNLILSTPLIEATKKIFVNASIDILIARQVKVLLESNPYLSNIFEFNHIVYIKNPLKLFQLVSSLRKHNYNIAIESSNPSGTSFLNSFVTYLTKAKYRIGFTGGGGELFTNIHVAPNNKDHYYLSKQKLVNIFSSNIPTCRPKIFTNQKEVETFRQNIQRKFNLQSDKILIGIWIGARHYKKWDINNFISVYRSIIKETGYFPILLFGIEECNEFDNINQNEYNSIYFDDLGRLKNFISCCGYFICGDTGPLHYAYSLGIPTIGIFLQDNFNTYGYSDNKNNFIVKPNGTEMMVHEIVNICKSLNT